MSKTAEALEGPVKVNPVLLILLSLYTPGVELFSLVPAPVAPVMLKCREHGAYSGRRES